MTWRFVKVVSGEVFEKVGALRGEAWKARVESEVDLGSLIAVVRANGRRSANAILNTLSRLI